MTPEHAAGPGAVHTEAREKKIVHHQDTARPLTRAEVRELAQRHRRACLLEPGTRALIRAVARDGRAAADGSLAAARQRADLQRGVTA